MLKDKSKKYNPPMLNAATTDWGHPIPPPTPTLTRNALGYCICLCTLSRTEIIMGKITAKGRLSVCPPLSASTAMSSHNGMSLASSACSF